MPRFQALVPGNVIRRAVQRGRSGLVSLTHTPSPIGLLGELLGRPANERAFLILVAGYAADGARVPDITRKPLEDVVTCL